MMAVTVIAPAQARFVPGLGEVSDCVPGATNCGSNRQPSKRAEIIRNCNKFLTNIPGPEGRRVANNCIALNTGAGFTICPNGRRQRVGVNGNRCD